MTIPSKPLAVGGVILGGGAAATGGVLLANRDDSPTLREKLGEYLLPKKTEQNKSLWVGRIGEAAKDEEIKKLFTEDVEDKKITALYEWCRGKLDERTSNEELLKKFQSFCTYSIKEKLGDKWILDVGTGTTNQTEYQELVEKLKTHEGNLKLTTRLEDIKGKSDAHTHLKTWCSNQYKQGYEGDNDLWKLVNKFCKKPTIQDKLNGTELPEATEVESDWGTKITSASAESNKESPKLKEKLNAITDDSNNTKKRDELKKWCQEQYKEPFDSLKTENSTLDNLLAEVKKWCTLTIKEKFDADTNKPSANLENEDTSWTNNSAKLKTYTAGGNNPTLAFGLKEIKEKTEDNERKNELKKWCEENWKRGYKGTNDAFYKLANQFCRKNP